MQIAANDDGSMSDAGGILPTVQGERATLSPNPNYRPDLKDLVERIANAKPEDAPALRAEIRARYHDVGDTIGGDALDRALSDAVEPGVMPADRQAILEGIAPYAKGNPEDVGAIREAVVTAILHMPSAGAARAAATARDPAATGSMLKSILEQNPAEYANARAALLQSALPERTAKEVTMAVGVVEDAQGVRSVVISSTEMGKEGISYLRPTVQALVQPNEIRVPAADHAKINILNYAKANKSEGDCRGCGRPYCPECGEALDATGVLATGPRK